MEYSVFSSFKSQVYLLHSVLSFVDLGPLSSVFAGLIIQLSSCFYLKITGTHLNLTESSFSNGIISCTFRRSKEVDNSVAQETFSLKNTNRYMLIGRGPVIDGKLFLCIRCVETSYIQFLNMFKLGVGDRGERS